MYIQCNNEEYEIDMAYISSKNSYQMLEILEIQSVLQIFFHSLNPIKDLDNMSASVLSKG